MPIVDSVNIIKVDLDGFSPQLNLFFNSDWYAPALALPKGAGVAAGQCMLNLMPVALFCPFNWYRDWIIRLSKKARHTVIWTLDESPLEVHSTGAPKDVYAVFDKNECLTQQDIDFKNLKCKQKFRVVVFRDTPEVERYVLAGGVLETRRRSFERSTAPDGVGGLRFTERTLLTEDKRFAFSEMDLDFGFLSRCDNKSRQIAFFSSFDSKSKGSDVGHVIFYPIATSEIQDPVNKVSGFLRELRDIPKYKAFFEAVRSDPVNEIFFDSANTLLEKLQEKKSA